MAAITAELALEVSKFQGSLRQAQDSLRSFRSRAQRQGSGLGTSMFAGVGKAAALTPFLSRVSATRLAMCLVRVNTSTCCQSLLVTR